MKEIRDLTGQRFGRWTVIGGYVTQVNSRRRTERKWLCRCDCGSERHVLERSLLSGGSKSCGCASAENSGKAVAYDLAGRSFGDLSVVARAEDHPRDSRGGVWWRCRCSCGKECDVLASLLVTGRKTSCGCKSSPKYHYENIEGMTFGDLTAEYPLPKRDKKGGVIWHCKCACGGTAEVPYDRLVYSDTRSCGCRKKEHDKLLGTFLTRVDGTSIDIIKSKKLPTDNTSGVKGVYYTRGKWAAKIVFQKRQYHLGKYDTIEEAAEVRREAEELIFGGTARHYARWKAKADLDPCWAEANPIEIRVSKKNLRELSVIFLPEIV